MCFDWQPLITLQQKFQSNPERVYCSSLTSSEPPPLTVSKGIELFFAFIFASILFLKASKWSQVCLIDFALSPPLLRCME